jgi:3-hydroxyacyl-CoA dehydrogenase
MPNKVVIIGSGMMGSGIAAISALAGNHTVLVDVIQEAAKKGIVNAKESIAILLKNELAAKKDAKTAETLLEWNCCMKDALKNADMVIEAVYENLELKQKLFKEIDALLPPKVPIASNTSGLRITDIVTDVKYKERTMTTHFWFPAHLVPLVEVVMSDWTDPEIALKMKNELNRWGKKAVLVKKDLPGQLANRILQAIIREAASIVEMGLASPEDVDIAVKMGMGIRFPAWGPLEHVDGVGVDLCTLVQNTVLPSISADKEVCTLMEDMVKRGDLGAKTGKGFYNWNEKDMNKLKDERDNFIIEALKILKRENL